MKLRDASQSVGWLNTEGPLSTTPVPAADAGREIVSNAVRSHGRDAALPREFVDALTAGIDDAIGRYKAALEAIVTLDFKKTQRGGDDYYSGPDRFIQAWLIAYRAIYPGADASPAKDPIADAVDAQLDPLKAELVDLGHKLAKEELRCSECGAYHPTHKRRNCQGAHIVRSAAR